MEVGLTPGGMRLPEAPLREALFLRRTPSAEESVSDFSLYGAAGDPLAELDQEGLKDLLKKTVDLVDALSMNRHLKFEVIDEAGLVQVQVIDTIDGNIVRKIPSDAIVKLVSRIRETLNERLDVVA